MKKNGSMLLAVLIAFALAGCDACKENVFTKLGDNIAVIGKDGLEKEAALAERAGARAAECAEQKAEEMKEKMGL